MTQRQQIADDLLSLTQRLATQTDDPERAAATLKRLEAQLHTYRTALAEEWSDLYREDKRHVEVGVKTYRRTIRLQTVHWTCMHCGTTFEEERPPGTFLPRYCPECNQDIRKHRDRARARRRSIEQANLKEVERAEAKNRRPKLKEFAFKNKEEEQLCLRPAQYCHNCGHNFGASAAGTATDILKKICPTCNQAEADTEQQYREHNTQFTQAKQQWRMPRISTASRANIKRSGRLATLGSGEIEKERQE